MSKRNPAREVAHYVAMLLSRSGAIQQFSMSGERLPAVEVELSTAVGETGRFLITVEPVVDPYRQSATYRLDDGALQGVLF